MIDFFALLAQPRQPNLDLSALEKSFHRLAQSLHPDLYPSATQDQFAEVNQAFATLRDPQSRLHHLLALENQSPSIAPAVGEYSALFVEAAEIAHEAGETVRRHPMASSTIARSIAHLKRAESSAKVRRILLTLEHEYDRGLERLKELNALWQSDRPVALEEARRLQQHFTFLGRWQGNLRELLFQLEH